MVIHNAAITGSLTYNGIDISDITGSEAGVGALNDFSASINNYTSSNNANITALNSFSSSILSYTSSNDAKLTALNAQTASILSYTSSNDAKIAAIYTATSSLNASVSALNTQSASLLSYTSSLNASVTALNAQTASLLSFTASTILTDATQSAKIAALEAATASLYTATSSFSARVGSLEAQSASLLSYTSSNTINVAALFAASASLSASVAGLNLQTASLLSYTSSNDAKISAIYGATSSLQSATASLNAFSGSILSYTSSTDAKIASIYTTTSSLNASVSSLNTYTQSITDKTASFATTGSNTFTGQQYISNNTNANGFATATGSLYTDGGMRVTKDMYVSGTAYFNNVTVYGTQSVSYITSSQLNISTNLITVNTATPSVRFGGLAVYDSGSTGTGLTGSLLWDSQNNVWIYTNPSGAAYDGGMVLMGPPNYSTTGNEVGITTNALAKGAGSHHMTSSGIFESGSGNVGIGSSSPIAKLDVQGTGYFSSTLTLGGGSRLSAVSGNGLNFNTNGADVMSINTSGCVGIGTTSPSYKLDVLQSSDTNYGINIQNSSGRYASIGYSGTYQLDFGATGTNDNVRYGVFSSGGGTSAFYTNATERMRITYDGNVGIGITTPSAILHTAGTTKLGGGGFYASTDQTFITTYSYTFRDAMGINNPNSLSFPVTSTYTVAIGSTSGGGSLTTAGPILISGSITSAVANYPQLVLNSTNNNGPQLRFQGGGSNTSAIGHISSVSDLQFSSTSSLAVQMTLNSAGNVGIGTTSPASLLNIASTAPVLTFTRTDNATNPFAAINFASTSTVRWQIATNNAVGTGFEINQANGSTNRFYIDTNGNVGIGTTSPSLATLQVVKAGAGQSDGNGAIMARASDGDQNWVSIGNFSTAGSSYGWIQASSNAAYKNLILNPTGGNVGIGTTTAPAKLTVSGSAAQMLALDTSIANGPYQVFRQSGADGFYIGSRGAVSGTGGTGYDLYSVNDLRLFSNGSFALAISGSNVGIGTTSPGAHFHVYSSGGPSLWLTAGGSGTGGLRIIKGDSGTAYINNQDSVGMQFQIAGSTKMTIDSGGNVGIGTTSPSSPLEISAATGTQLKIGTNDSTSANNSGIFFYNEASSNSATRRSYVLLDPNGANASGGDYSYFDMYGSGTARVMNQLTAGTLALGVGGTNILNITGSNVGIGTTSPDAVLAVHGQFKIRTTNGDGNESRLFFNPGGAADPAQLYLYNEAQSNTIYVTANGSSYFNGGNVGIGTTSPSGLLNLNNGDAWINVTSTLRGLQFGYGGPTHGSYRAAVMGGAESYGGSDSGMLTFHTQVGYVTSSIPPERMRISSGGQVGIGTTATISESNLVLGALGTSEGGQLTLQAGTSYPSASHLDNYQNRFRVMSGTNAGSNAEKFTVNMADGTITTYGNILSMKSTGGGTYKQTVVGQISAAASGVSKKIAYVGHTHSIRVYLYIVQDTANVASGIADFTTSYGSSSGGITASSRLGNISSISSTYDNGGSPGYTINVSVAYTGAAPTINYVIEGINNDNNIYTL
jgi:hypothetical protein